MRFVSYDDLGTGEQDRLGVDVFGVVYDLAGLVERIPPLAGMPALPLPATIWEYHAFDAATKAQFAALLTALGQVDPAQRAGLIRHQVQRRSPVGRPTSLRCFAAFEEHVRAVRQRRGMGMPTEWYESPAFFFGNHTAVYGHGEEVPQPISFWLDFELQIACVIGMEGRNIRAEDAEAYIAGYTIMNDWCARDQEMYEMRLGFGAAKGRDFAISLGPSLVTPDELQRYSQGEGPHRRYDLAMDVTINDHPLVGLLQGNFRDVHFTFPQMIERASADATLYPGDVLGSGAVANGSLLSIGAEEVFGRWLQTGDVIDLEVEGLGVLRNVIGAPKE
ncbi:MAG: fumarylacetoacetate hydrolase family protein [Anaerolineae bacterium]|nr:fumarylacetoacetate hydrolase family protein [Anaerolineae bacterium]